MHPQTNLLELPDEMYLPTLLRTHGLQNETTCDWQACCWRSEHIAALQAHALSVLYAHGFLSKTLWKHRLKDCGVRCLSCARFLCLQIMGAQAK